MAKNELKIPVELTGEGFKFVSELLQYTEAIDELARNHAPFNEYMKAKDGLPNRNLFDMKRIFRTISQRSNNE